MITKKRIAYPMLKKPVPVKIYFGYIIGLFLINTDKCVYYTLKRGWCNDIANTYILDREEFDKAIRQVNKVSRRFKQVFVCKCTYTLYPTGQEKWNIETRKHKKVIGKKFKSLTRLHPFQGIEHLIHKL